MNYTAEQKQYNNWLTERLLEITAQHNYEFDPEDFNFVAIRDRIRCYYKSYVQTARKRGLKLPEKKKDWVPELNKLGNNLKKALWQAYCVLGGQNYLIILTVKDFSILTTCL